MQLLHLLIVHLEIYFILLAYFTLCYFRGISNTLYGSIYAYNLKLDLWLLFKAIAVLHTAAASLIDLCLCNLTCTPLSFAILQKAYFSRFVKNRVIYSTDHTTKRRSGVGDNTTTPSFQSG